MKKFLSCLVLTSFVLNNTLIMSPAFAAKKAGSTALSIKASDGTAIVYGSVLSPRSNRLKIKLTGAILSAIRSQGIDDAQITITKIAADNETSNVYSISSDNVDIIGKSLVFDVVPCTDPSGATVTAGALAAGTYTLNITIGSTSASGTFEFNPPAVVVGTVEPGSSGSCTGGTNNISSISGDSIGQLVALSSNCTYFNEVQARKASKKGNKKGKGRLAAQEDGSSTSSGDAAADAGFYEDPNAGATDTAIVEATVVVTDETGATDVEEFSAPVNLDPENNGDATNISEETTEVVDAALDLVVGDQTGDGVTDEEDIQEVANEDAGAVIEQFEQVLDDSVVTEEITDDGTTGEVVGEQFQPASDCGDKIMSVVGTVDLMTVTDSDLKTIGGKLIPEIQTGSLINCVPPFVKDFIPSFFKNICGSSTTQCDEGLIGFAKKFLFNVGKNENQPPVDPKQICQKLKEGLSGLKNCKGEGCPPPPCFPQDLREKLKAECAELVATLPQDCQPPQAVCNLQPKGPQGNPNGGQPPSGGTSGQVPPPPTGGTSGQVPPPPPGNTSGQTLMTQISPGAGPLGASPSGGQCMDAGKPQDASICKLCNTAGPEGCTGPVLIPSNMADDGSTCVLPEVQCIPFTSLSATSPDAMFDGICLFGDGDLTVGEEDDKPKDPRTCKPFPFDPKLGCPQLRPSCKPTDDLSTFDKVCCQLPQGQPGGPNGGPGNPGGQPPTGGTSGQVPPPPPGGTSGQVPPPPTGGTTTTSGQPPVARLTQDQVDARTNECVLRKLCSDPSNFGADGKPDSTKLEALKTACQQGGGQQPPNGGTSGQPGGMSGQPGNSACIQDCKSKCGEDQACLQECGKSCQPTGGTSGQPPCDPTKDPNCKPPTGGTSGQPPCDPATDPNCKPPTGGTSGQPPCDPLKDPNCKPPTGGTSGQPPCDPLKDPNCKPPTDGGTTGTSGCPEGQVKDPATGQCKPADGGTTGTSGCPQGQVKDPATGLCKPADGGTTGTSGCPQGQVKDPATGLCKPADGGTTQPPPNTCPTGQVKCSDGSCKTTCP